jgi:hypothetical protein
MWHGQFALLTSKPLHQQKEEHIGTYSHRYCFWEHLPQWLRPADLERRWDWTLVEARRSSAPPKNLPISIWVIRPTGAHRSQLPTLGVLILQEGLTSSDGKPVLFVNLLGIHPACRTMEFWLFRRPGQVRGVAHALLNFASEFAKSKGCTGGIGLDAVGRSRLLYERMGLIRSPKGDKGNGTRYYEGFVK